MSRGLSQQQRLILGLAVAMSRYHYGEPKAHIPQTLPNWRIPIALTESGPDVTANLCAHFIHGIRIEYWKAYCNKKTAGIGPMKLTPEARAAINSASRAINNLARKGLLCYRGYRQWTRGFVYGYVLTAAGLDAGRQYEIESPANIEHRLVAFGWILDDRGYSRWGSDESIPLTFEHPQLLARCKDGTAPTDTAASVSVGDVSGPARRQQIHRGASVGANSDRRARQHIEDAVLVSEIAR